MRDRLFELLPVVLVVLILLAFQVGRTDGSIAAFLPLGSATSNSPAASAESSPPLQPPVGSALQPAVEAAATGRPTLACDPARPRFVGRVAMLRAALGASMGDPATCESDLDAEGNTQQKTSTGLAYYRKALNVTCFTNGWDHWALLPRGDLVHWTGQAIDPPPDASPIARL
jgi:hypothetical protein